MPRNSKNLLIEGKYGCSYVVPNIAENVGFDIWVNGIYEPETFELLNTLIPPNGSFLDIGGNIGAVTIPLCKRRSDIRAIAVEAAPWIFPYLERNINDNKIVNAKLLNSAVYDQDGLQMDFFSPLDKFGKGSLAKVFTVEPVKVVTKTVETIMAEQKMKEVDVIKVDVEGFEYFVFKGARQLLLGYHAPAIFFEFVDWAERNANGLMPGTAQQYLLDLGYQLFVISGKSKRTKIDSPLSSGSYNILAVKSDS